MSNYRIGTLPYSEWIQHFSIVFLMSYRYSLQDYATVFAEYCDVLFREILRSNIGSRSPPPNVGSRAALGTPTTTTSTSVVTTADRRIVHSLPVSSKPSNHKRRNKHYPCPPAQQSANNHDNPCAFVPQWMKNPTEMNQPRQIQLLLEIVLLLY